MLLKLIKYDLKQIYKIPCLLYIILAVVSLFVGLTLRNDSPDYLSVLLPMSLYIIVISVVAVATLIIPIVYFAKNIFGHEGYLMNTLPVTPIQLFLAKLFSTLILIFVSTVAAILSLLIINVLIINRISLSQIIDFINDFLVEFDIDSFMSFNVVLSTILHTLFQYFRLYAAVAIGHSFNDNKVLKSILSYVGISFAVSIITSILEFTTLLIDTILIVSNILLIIGIALLFIVVIYIMSYKLNLE